MTFADHCPFLIHKDQNISFLYSVEVLINLLKAKEITRKSRKCHMLRKSMSHYDFLRST